MATQILTPPHVEWATDTTLPIVLRLSPVIEMTEEQFDEFCALNDDIRIERTANGELELMPPAYSDTGSKELDIAAELRSWARQDGSGVTFGPSAGFTLPNGAVRSPDAAWIPRSRLAELTPEQRSGFAHICPDFVIELRSSSDRLSVLRAKMDEYIQNGARLGWLIDTRSRRVYVYRPDREVETLENLESLSAEPELPGFTLELEEVWEEPF